MAGAGGIVNAAAIKASTVHGNTASGGARWRHPYHGVMIIRPTRMTGETAPADSSGEEQGNG